MQDANRISSALIVEDGEAVAFLLNYMLRREGYAVSRVADGRAAAEFISSKAPPDIVLLDIMLPYLDGFEILDLIRAHPDWRHTPVIILSGRSQEIDAVRALNAGASDFVRKPYQARELMARIKCRMEAANRPGPS